MGLGSADLIPVKIDCYFALNTTTLNPTKELRLVGGVNHCSLHCRLAKIRGMLIRGKYGAVIG
jgi:hypothetical protein